MFTEVIRVINSTGLVQFEALMVLAMQKIVLQVLRKIMSFLGKKKTATRSEVNNRAIEGSTGIDEKRLRPGVLHQQRSSLPV